MKVHVPNKDYPLLDKALTQLYVMKAAVDYETPARLKERINKIRKILLKVKENNIQNTL